MCARLASIESGSAIAHGSRERRRLKRQHELLELQRCASRAKLAAARACTPGESAVLLHVSAQDEATVRCSARRAEGARTRTHAAHAPVSTREYPGSTPRVPREYPVQWHLRRHSARRRADWAQGGGPSGACVCVDKRGGVVCVRVRVRVCGLGGVGGSVCVSVCVCVWCVVRVYACVHA